MRLGLIAIGVCAVLFAGCATSLSSSGAIATTTLADGTSPLHVVADQAPVPAVVETSVPAMLRVVSDDPGAPPVPPAPSGPGGMPVVEAPARGGFVMAAPQAPGAASDCYWPTPAPRCADEPPAPPAEPASDEIVEEAPLTEIEPPAPTESAPMMRSGCCPTPCQPTCCEPCDEKGYVGGSLSVIPGLGGGIEWGIHTKITDCAVWSFELGMQYQDFTKSITNEKANGSLTMATVGMRIRMQPRSSGHITARFGLSWVHAEGNPIDVDTASLDWRGDYIGVYAGIGYEWDLGCHWSTGPEARVYGGYAFDQLRDRDPVVGANPSRSDFGFFGMFLWHLDYRF